MTWLANVDGMTAVAAIGHLMTSMPANVGELAVVGPVTLLAENADVVVLADGVPAAAVYVAGASYCGQHYQCLSAIVS